MPNRANLSRRNPASIQPLYDFFRRELLVSNPPIDLAHDGSLLRENAQPCFGRVILALGDITVAIGRFCTEVFLSGLDFIPPSSASTVYDQLPFEFSKTAEHIDQKIVCRTAFSRQLFK